MKLIELGLKDKLDTISLQDIEIEFIYRATKSNLFSVTDKALDFLVPKYSCDLKTLYARMPQDKYWAIKFAQGDIVYYMELKWAFVVPADSDFSISNALDIKINMNERLLVVAGDVKAYRRPGKSNNDKSNTYVINKLNYDTQCVELYPYQPIALDTIEDRLVDYKIYYTKRYVDNQHETDAIIGEVDTAYFYEHYDFFRTLSYIGEDNNTLVVPIKRSYKPKPCSNVMLTTGTNVVLGSVRDSISFDIYDQGKDKDFWQNAADKFKRLKNLKLKDDIVLCKLNIPQYDKYENLVIDKNNTKLFVRKDISGELTRLGRIISGINTYLENPNAVVNDKLCSQVLDPDNFVLNTSYTKTYINALKMSNPNLNQEQLIAVDKVLCMEAHNQDVMLIQGPSGTGKTELIATIIKELLSQDKSVFVSSNTHPAIDTMVERVQGEKEIVVKKFTRMQGDGYKNEIKLNKINYIKNQILGRFKIDEDIVDSVEKYNLYKKESQEITSSLQKVSGFAELKKVESKKQKLVEKKEAIEKEIASKNSVIGTAKRVIQSINDFIVKFNDNLAVCDITDLKRLYLDTVNDFNVLYEGFVGEEYIDDKVNKYIVSTKSAAEKTLSQIENKINQFIDNEEEIFNVDNSLKECMYEIDSREYVLNNVNTILDNVKKNILLGRKYSDNIEPKYFEILENNSRLNSSDRVSKILKSVSIRQDVLDLEAQGKLNLEEKVEILARIFVDLNSYVFSIPLSAEAFEKYLSLSDSAKRWSRLFKKKKFKGVSYKDFVTEVDADISAILKNDIDKLFDEDKEYLFMSVPLQEETQEFRKTAKDIEASLNKLYDKKSKITKDASVIRMPYVETEFDAIIKAIQNDIVVICKQLDKLDATLAPIEDELASANYQIKQKSLVLTRRQQEIDTVISNIEKALKQVAYKEFLFDYISTLKNLIDNPANNPADIEYINTMLGLDSEIITDYDNIFEYVDNRGALAMSTSQVKSFIKSIENTQEERFVFDYAIIDEASKCNIADLIVSLPNIKKLILIGDYMHLDPSFTQYEKLDDLDGWVPKAITTEEKWQALNLSNFRQMFKVVKEQMEERSLQDYYSVSNVAILKRQYKMNEDIFSYVKDIYAIHEGFELIDEKRYGGKDILPLQIDGDEVIENDFIDKIYNPKEIEFVKDLVQNLSKNIDKYNNIKSIGIIGLYDWHTRLIKYQIDALDLDKTIKKSGVSISIGTVEKMQNKEFDMVILSCVKTKELGNLSDVRILNSALSRAKQKIIILANFKALKNIEPYYKRELLPEIRKELETVYNLIIPRLCRKCKVDNSTTKYNLEQVGKFLKVVNKDE